jgi:hypothetical protein
MMALMHGDSGRRGTVRRLLVVCLVDVAAAALVSIVAFRLLGAYSGADTNPPVCYNAAGGVVSCALSQTVVMLPASP